MVMQMVMYNSNYQQLREKKKLSNSTLESPSVHYKLLYGGEGSRTPVQTHRHSGIYTHSYNT